MIKPKHGQKVNYRQQQQLGFKFRFDHGQILTMMRSSGMCSLLTKYSFPVFCVDPCNSQYTQVTRPDKFL